MSTYLTSNFGGFTIINDTALYNKIVSWATDYDQLPILWTPDGGNTTVTASGQKLQDIFPIGTPVWLGYPDDCTVDPEQLRDLNKFMSVGLVPIEMPATSTSYTAPFVGSQEYSLSGSYSHTQETLVYSLTSTLSSLTESLTAPTGLLGTAFATTGSTTLNDVTVCFILATANIGIAQTVYLESYQTNIAGVDGRSLRLQLGAQTPLSLLKELLKNVEPTRINPGQPPLAPGKGGVTGPVNGIPPDALSPGGSGNGGNSGVPGSPGRNGKSERAGGQTTGSMTQPDNDQPVETPPIVSPSFVSFLYTIYNMVPNDASAFAKAFWQDDTQIALQEAYQSNPIDVIIDFFRMPIPTTTVGNSYPVKLGKYQLKDEDGYDFTLPVCTSEFVDIDFGNVVVREKFHGFLDYHPYTKIKLYLPYIGFVDVDPQDVMSTSESNEDIASSVNLSYRVSLLSGDFTATLRWHKGEVLDKIMYQWTGNMATRIPLTRGTRNLLPSQTWKNWGNEAVQNSHWYNYHPWKPVNPQGKWLIGRVMSGLSSFFEGSTPSNIGKQESMNVNRGGSLSGNVGELGSRKAFFLVERPNPNVPDYFGSYHGYASNIYVQALGELTGFTKCQSVHLDNLPATEAEMSEIHELLTSGVIL